MVDVGLDMHELTFDEIENVAGGMSDETESFLWGLAIGLAICAL